MGKQLVNYGKVINTSWWNWKLWETPGEKTSLEGSIPCLIQGTFSGQPPRGQNDLGEIISIEWGIRYTGIPNNKPLEDGLFSWAYHIQKKTAK